MEALGIVARAPEEEGPLWEAEAVLSKHKLTLEKFNGFLRENPGCLDPVR